MNFGDVVNLVVSDLGCFVFKADILKGDFAVFLAMRTPRFPPFHCAVAVCSFNRARALDGWCRYLYRLGIVERDLTRRCKLPRVALVACRRRPSISLVTEYVSDRLGAEGVSFG